MRYLIWFIAALYILNYLDISITPLLAGAGIAGIAIALATQDLLSNLFGGVIILLDRPLGEHHRLESLRREVERHERVAAEGHGTEESRLGIAEPLHRARRAVVAHDVGDAAVVGRAVEMLPIGAVGEVRWCADVEVVQLFRCGRAAEEILHLHFHQSLPARHVAEGRGEEASVG